DGLSNIDLKALLAFHEGHGRLATVSTIRPTSRFGNLIYDEQGLVSEFIEKPVMNDWISAGFFVFNRQIFDYLSPEPSCVLETAPLEKMVAEQQLMAYQHHG